MKTFTLTADGPSQDVVNGISVDRRTFGLRWIQIGCCTFQARITIYHTTTSGNDPRTTSVTIGTNSAQYGTGVRSGRMLLADFCSSNCARVRRVTRVTIEPLPGNGCGSTENTYKLCMCFCANQTSQSGFPSDTATCDGATCTSKYVAA